MIYLYEFCCFDIFFHINCHSIKIASFIVPFNSYALFTKMFKLFLSSKLIVLFCFTVKEEFLTDPFFYHETLFSNWRSLISSHQLLLLLKSFLIFSIWNSSTMHRCLMSFRFSVWGICTRGFTFLVAIRFFNTFCFESVSLGTNVKQYL